MAAKSSVGTCLKREDGSGSSQALWATVRVGTLQALDGVGKGQPACPRGKVSLSPWLHRGKALPRPPY